jgi:hypothetical protein
MRKASRCRLLPRPHDGSGLLPPELVSSSRDESQGCIDMAKASTTDTSAAALSVPERVLLFCLASEHRLGEGGRSRHHRPAPADPESGEAR